MKTSNESLVNMLAERGISISYDRLRRLSTALINSVIGQAPSECIVSNSFSHGSNHGETHKRERNKSE